MALPEFATSVGFWVKFVPLFFLFVILPIFFLDFTSSMTFGRKILFMLGGAIGLMLALNGKTIKYGKHRQR